MKQNFERKGAALLALCGGALAATNARAQIGGVPQEAPRAPIAFGAPTGEPVVPNAGANLFRNGSFEGSYKYHALGGEWHDARFRPVPDGTTAAVGRFSARLDNTRAVGGLQTMPFHAKWNTLYCVSFYARAEGEGTDWNLNALARAMHWFDNGKWGSYPELRSDKRVTRGWKRFHFFFPANRIVTDDKNVANSYTLWFFPDDPKMRRFWLDGVQVEEVPNSQANLTTEQVRALTKPEDVPQQIAGFPTAFKLSAPVEVCAETINLPAFAVFRRVGDVARVRASIVNNAQPRRVRVTWTLMDHRNRALFRADSQTRTLKANENWQPVANLRLPQKGAMLCRVEVRDENARVLNFSDEPLTVLPFDNTNIGSDFDERFGVAGSFSDANTPDAENVGLGFSRLLGFRWIRSWGLPNFKSATEIDFSEGEAKINWAHARGYRQFLLIGDYPEWLRQPNEPHNWQFPNARPSDMQWPQNDPRWDDLTVQTHFDRYLRAIATRYKGKIDAYQLGNETTAPGDDGKQPAWVRHHMTRRAARVLKSIDPKVPIIGGNTIWTRIGEWEQGIKLGTPRDIDFWGWDFDCYLYGGHSYEELSGIRAKLKAEGGRDIPLFNYETGYGSGWMQDYTADPVGSKARTDYSVLPDDMTRNFARTFAAGSRQWILHLAMYQRNLQGTYENYTHWPVQLHDDQERPRVTLAPMNVAIRFLGLSDALGPVSRSDLNIEAYAFRDRRANRPVVVFWASEPKKEGDQFGAVRDRAAFTQDRVLSLQLNASTLFQSDTMGNVKPVARKNGAWQIVLRGNGEPSYLLGAPNTRFDASSAFRALRLSASSSARRPANRR